jgi:hypothetical protein
VLENQKQVNRSDRRDAERIAIILGLSAHQFQMPRSLTNNLEEPLLYGTGETRRPEVDRGVVTTAIIPIPNLRPLTCFYNIYTMAGRLIVLSSLDHFAV